MLSIISIDLHIRNPSISFYWHTCINLTCGSNLGGRPKCKIQLRRAPNKRIVSARCSAVVRADETQFTSLSSTTPFPIGVGRTGKLNVVTKSRTITSAPAYAAPELH
jgi:hypothetical protein